MLEKSQKRAIISFYHPKGNSLSKEQLTGLATEINQAAEDPAIKVIILKSQGEKAFCGGASFEELRSVKNSEEAKDFFMGFAILLSAIRRCPKFIIARVQGKAVGGGVGLIAACDYAIAHQSASIKLAELEIGIGPFVIASAVEKKIGKGEFSFLTIDTQWRDAAWCKLHSLYAEVYNTIEEMDSAIENLAERLSECNPEAMAEIKHLFWEGTEDWNILLAERAQKSGKLVLSDFTAKFLSDLRKGS